MGGLPLQLLCCLAGGRNRGSQVQQTQVSLGWNVSHTGNKKEGRKEGRDRENPKNDTLAAPHEGKHDVDTQTFASGIVNTTPKRTSVTCSVQVASCPKHS